jgi:hypothetical protein
MNHKKKPLGRKNYGSIPHLPGSRTGPGDHACHEGQARIATLKARDKHDEIFVTEKLDGSNVGVVRLDNTLYALGRAGYLASSSPYEQHGLFADWVYCNHERFMAVLLNGERLVGEWLAQAHGTKYHLRHEPFVAFDLMKGNHRLAWREFKDRVVPEDFITPTLLAFGRPISIEDTMINLGLTGFHGAEKAEGAVWRVERDKLVDRHSGRRKRVVDYLVKYVRPDKIDGCYLEKLSGQAAVWNWEPD